MGDDIDDGLGPARSGPEFQVAPSGQRVAPPAPRAVPSRSARPSRTARQSRRPAVITALVVAIVAAIAIGGTIYARQADVRAIQAERSAAEQETKPVPAPSQPANQIEFATRGGTGTLRIVDHVWLPVRGEPPNAGEALEIQVEIVCTTGEVGYDPFYFQAFDSVGSVYDMSAEEVRGQVMGVGSLQPGESVRGSVAFVIPRGEVTLLMSDDATSVTALRVPD